MKRIAALLGVTAFVMMATACNETPDTHAADVKALKHNEMEWVQDWASRAPEKIAAHYTDDAVLMAGGMAAISGKDAIQDAVKQMVSDPTFKLTFETSKVDVAKSGDLAYTQGTYTISSINPHTKKATNDHGSYVTVYRKQADGTWKAISDIATSEAPPPAPAAAGKAHAGSRKAPAATRKKKHSKR